jgi:recombination protein RecA
MPESNVEAWRALGVHHKTAEKLATLKLSPEKAKEISDEDLKSKYGINDDTVAKIRGAVSGSPPVKGEVAAKKVADDKPAKKGKKVDEKEKEEGPPKTLAEKQKVIAQLIKESDGLIKRASDPEILYGKRTTGFAALDAELSDGQGKGGYPMGKPVLFAGGFQSAKTSAALRHIAVTQQNDPNAICLWGDAENSFDAPWAKKLGVDLDRLLIVPPMIADHMITQLEEAIERIAPAAIVIDSIGSLLSWQEVMKKRDDEEFTKDISQDTVALTARFLGKFYRRWTPMLAKLKPTLILITHIYTVIGPVPFEEAKGGNAMKHSSHVVIWFSRRKGDQEKKEKIKMADGRVAELFTAYEVVMTIQKTRQSPTEGHKIVIPFVYGKGLSEVDSVIEMAMAMGLLQQNGSYYTHPTFNAILQGQSNNWVNGRQNVIDFVKANQSVFDALLMQVGDAMAADDRAPEEVADAAAVS